MTAVFDDWVAICSLEIGAQTAGPSVRTTAEPETQLFGLQEA